MGEGGRSGLKAALGSGYGWHEETEEMSEKEEGQSGLWGRLGARPQKESASERRARSASIGPIL